MNMRMWLRGAGLLVGLLFALSAAAQQPTVRAVTAFIDLDPATYERQITETAGALQKAKAALERAGFEVQTTRITTQPFPKYVGGMSRARAIALLDDVARIRGKLGVAVSIGPAVLDDAPDPAMLEVLEELHGKGSPLNASMIVAGETGVHWNAVRAAARHMKQVSIKSKRSQGTFSFAAMAMLPPGAPFYPASYHIDGNGRFAIGLQAANVVGDVFKRTSGDPVRATRELTAALNKHAKTIEQVARTIERETGLRYWGLDATPAPLKEESIGAAIEAFTGARFGAPGTMTAVSVITESLRQMEATRIGYNGLMLPVMEDQLLAQRWSEGTLTIDGLLAYSAVCGTGLDTVPLPGDVTEAQLARIIGDVAVLAFKWKKPLTARLQPVHGRKAGEMSEFDDPFLVNAKLQPLK